jgi:Cu/Ag efflux protein CusF
MEIALTVLVSLSAATLTYAREDAHSSHHTPSADNARETAGQQMSEGEIRKVNKDAGKITIRHGELTNLDMPPMTMVFQANDPAMLDQVKAGDKIRFVANKVGGKFIVMQLEVRN